jgi:hypothetical protein
MTKAKKIKKPLPKITITRKLYAELKSGTIACNQQDFIEMRNRAQQAEAALARVTEEKEILTIKYNSGPAGKLEMVDKKLSDFYAFMSHFDKMSGK